jgi:hypothetical protein
LDAARGLHEAPLMKVVFACLLLSGIARADALQSIELVEQLDTARVERASGAVLSLIAAAMAVSSIGMVASAGAKAGGVPVDCGPDVTCQKQQPIFYAGVGLAVASSVFMSIGIPMWVIGNEKVRQLEKRARISGFVGKSGGGASVRVSF